MAVRKTTTPKSTPESGNPDKLPSVTTATPKRQNKGEVTSRPAIQYIATTPDYPYLQTDIILANTADEAEEKNGPKIYDIMALEPVMAGIDLWFKANVLSDGIKLMPPELDIQAGGDKPSEADKTEAAWGVAYCTHTLKRASRVDRDIYAFLWNMLDGARLPHKLAEITYDVHETGPFKGFTSIERWTPKPRGNYNFVVDEMYRFRGVIGLIPGGSQALWSGIIYDASRIPNCVAPEKLLRFSMNDADSDPRGLSLWRGAYKPWAEKQRTLRRLSSAEMASAGSKVTVVLGDGGGVTFQDPITGAEVSEKDAIATSLRGFTNEGFVILNNGSVPMVWYPPAGILDGFLANIDRQDREMVLPVLTNARAIFEAEHGSKADTDNASDDTAIIKLVGRQRVCLMINQLLFNLCKLAKGEDWAVQYAPVAKMNRDTSPDFSMNATAVAQLIAADAIAPSQYAQVYSERLGITPPTPQELEAMDAAWLQRQKIKATAPLPGDEASKTAATPSQGQPSSPANKPASPKLTPGNPARKGPIQK